MPLHTYYDTRLAPVTFDYAVFLVGAEAYRQQIGVSSLYLYVVAPEFRHATPREHATELSEKRWRVKHILGQLPDLMPTVQRVTLQQDTFNQISFPNYPPAYPPRPGETIPIPYYPRVIVKQFRAGCDVQPYTSSEYAKYLVRSATRGHEYFTITLRTNKFQTERNSNLQSWYEVYRELKSHGYKVWVLPDFEDTYGAREAYKYDWPIATFALDDLELRLALYEDAKNNLAVNNGICVLLTFSKAPHTLFKMLTEGIRTTSVEYFKDNWMLDVGEQPPFFQPNQKWVWEDDTVENILAAIEY